MTDRPRPHSPADLFWSFTWLALQGFGGVLAVVQREIVEKKRWLTPEEFVEDWAVAQTMPGPNVINLAIMIGDRHFGLRGAVAALAGVLAAPMLIVLALALVYANYSHHPQVAGALRGMGAVAAGLITATGLKLVPALRRHPLGVPMCATVAVLCFALVALARVPLAWVLLGVGGASCVITWHRLKA
ncbi:MAG: hypothetical protein RL087_1175 [Pseudomonadota bacterium]